MDAGILFWGWVEIGGFLLIAGIILAALWYPRWVRYATIALYAVLLLPSVLSFDLKLVDFLVFYLSGLVLQVVLTEAISREVRGRARAQDRLIEIMTRNPAVMYGLTADADRPDRLKVTFVAANVKGLLGYEPDFSAERSATVVGLLGSVSTQEATAWCDELKTRGEAMIEYPVQRAKGDVLWVRDSCRAMRDEDGTIREIVGHILDVTERHQADEALRQTEARMRHIVSNSPLVTYSLQVRYTTRRDLYCPFVTDNIEALTGYSAQELMADQSLWGSRVNRADCDALWNANSEPQIIRAPVVEYRFNRRDGVEIWLEDTARAIFDDAGSLVEIIGHIQDITERKTAQFQIENSRRFIDRLATAIPSQVFVADIDSGSVVFANRVVPEILDYDKAKNLGVTIPEYVSHRIHPDDRSLFQKMVEALPALTDEVTAETRLRVSDVSGAWHYLLFRQSVFLRDAEGRPNQILVVWDDVTDRQQAEHELADSQRLLSRITATMPNAVYVVDLSANEGRGGFVYANRLLPDMLGYEHLPREEREDVGFVVNHIHPDDVSAWLGVLQAVPNQKDDEVTQIEFRVQAADGAWRWIRSWNMIFNRDMNGRAQQVLGLMEEITETRRAQEALAASQRLVTRVTETVPNVVYVLNLNDQRANGGVIFANRSLPAELGYDSELARRMGWEAFVLSLIHPDDLDIYNGARARWLDLSDGALLETDFRLRDSANRWRWYRARHLAFERDATGAVTQVIGQLEDITVSRELEAAVKAERDFAQLVLNSLGQGVAVLNPEGLCDYINPAGANILGLPYESVPGTDLIQMLPIDLQMHVMRDFLERAASGKALQIESEYLRPDGQIVDFLTTVTPRHLPDGEIGAVAVMTDVSERKAMELKISRANVELEHALERARDLAREAQAASRAKSEFLANMSHELRTPLTAILGFAETLLDDQLVEGQRHSVRLMVDSSHALLDIINDILDFSKIEAGHLQLNLHEFDLADIVESVADLMAMRARQKGLRLTCLIDPGLPATLIGDAGRLRQIVLNILSNAVKFTEKGNVAIEVTPLDRDGPDQWVRVRVKDTGIGVSPEAQRRLFNPFEQADGGTTRRFGGTGLGLAIVKRLVELMNGVVKLESAPGVGTVVDVELHFERPAAADGPAATLTRSGDRRAVIVDPDDASRAILARYATAAGYAVTAWAGPEQLWMPAEDAEAPDFAIVGLWEDDPATSALLARLTAEPASVAARVIVVADLPPDESTALAGFTWLNRPVHRHALSASLASAVVTDTATASVTIDVTTQPAFSTRPRVLLAEDNRINQTVATLQLDKLGFDVEVVNDGEAAVNAYMSSPDRYRLILMDCQMPRLDGFAATRRIRSWEVGTENQLHVPVIAMTANAMAGDREICLEAGMDDYLSKPVSIQALQDVLGRVRLEGAPPA